MTLERRRLLALVGAAATVGLAGCSDGGGDESGEDEDGEDAIDASESDGGDDAQHLELPAYSRWLTTDDDGELVYGYLDWASLEAVDGAVDEPFTEAELESDPMLGYPFVGALAVSTALGQGLGSFGLAGLFQESGAESGSRVDELLFVGQTSVVTGEFDVEEIDDVLTEASSASPSYDVTTAVAGYDVYTSAMDERSAIAVGPDALVFAVEADDPVEEIRPTLEAASGDGDRATDADDVAWLVATGGDGQFALGVYGAPEDLEDEEAVEDEADELTWDELDDAEGLVASLIVDGSDGFEGWFAAIVEEPDEAALEELLGTTADDGSVVVDGDRVSAAATW
ncbi:hypothetical protein [Natronobeatus ordinarius]|uniref:hypothetical protein n=1 Tax=Natronobeatus ordinarius TaxID=2963433 RepID=UPI0020CFD41C|nr:hypothetical protein [Natronobeatus ordinarius]